MTFAYAYYKPSLYGLDEDNLEDTSAKNAKLKEKLLSIQHSCPMLINLEFQDTEKLQDFLIKQKTEVKNSFFDAFAKDIENNGIQEDKDEEEIDDLIVNPYDKVYRFIELKGIKARSKKYPQLLSGVLNVPKSILLYGSLTENLLEHIIKKIIEVVPVCKVITTGEEISISPEFLWSYSTEKPRSKKNEIVFVYFTNAMMLYLFEYVVNKIALTNEDKTVEVFSDITYRNSIRDKIREVFDLDLTKLDDILDDLSDRFEELTRIGNLTLKKDGNVDDEDYITRCKNLVASYTVKPKDLSDVSPEIIDVVKKELIEFRVRFIKDQFVKHDYSHIIQKMKKNKIPAAPKGELHTSSTHLESADSKLSDIEYENIRQSKEKELEDKKYFTQLAIYKKKEDTRLKNYNSFNNLVKHESYVSKTIPNNRRKFLSSFVNNVVDEKNKIDKNFSYYTKHSNYVKYRLLVKEKEIARDSLEDENTEG